mgnify:CR=1 FL=1
MASITQIRHRLFLIALVPLLGVAAAGVLRADDTATETTIPDVPAEAAEAVETIIVTPSDDPNPPVTQLDPDSPPEPWDPAEIGDFNLVDQLGRPVTKESLMGRPWVANFIFTRCAHQCPAMCVKIKQILERLEDSDVRFVTITVDPEHDDVERMAQFADVYSADPDQWLFVTGDPAEVYRLIRKGFKVAAWENFGSDRLPGFEFAHSMALVHVGPDGRVLGKYNSQIDDELVTMRRVLEGRIETPPEHRPVPPIEEEPDLRNVTAQNVPAWVLRLPTTNASLNALATLLLLVGFMAVKAGKVQLHKQMMLYAFATSIAFLMFYLTYHFALHHYTGESSRKFTGTGTIRTVYLTILLTHVVLAAAVPVLASITIYRAWRQQWDKHRFVARITFPIWLYVSVTGVIIYWMLYHLPTA